MIREVPRVQQSPLFISALCFVEPPDVRADRAQPVVRVIQIGLERQSSLYFRDGFDMPEIGGLTPQNISFRQMGLRQIRVQLPRLLAMEFRSIDPRAARVEAEILTCTNIGGCRVCEGEFGICDDGAVY